MPQPDFGSLRPISREQPLERKEGKYATLWGNLETKAGGSYFPRFPRHFAVYANLELFWVEVSANDLNEDRKEPCKMKAGKSERHDLAYSSQEIGQAVVSL